MRVLLHSPKDTLAGLVAAAAVSAIVANALFLQTGRHPAPMFGTVINLPAPIVRVVGQSHAAPASRRRRYVAARAEATEFRVEPKPAEKAPEKPAETTASTPRAGDPMTNLVTRPRHATPAPSAVRRRASAGADPGRSRARAARRLAGVQRALYRIRLRQFEDHGHDGAETQSAIQKFEREHKMPVTGQVSDRLLRELAAAIGHPVE